MRVLRPHRDLPGAIESGAPAGTWTQRGPSAARFQSKFVSKIKSWTHRTHLAPSLFVYNSPIQIGFEIYCVHCVHRRGFAGLLPSMVRPFRVRVRTPRWEEIALGDVAPVIWLSGLGR